MADLGLSVPSGRPVRPRAVRVTAGWFEATAHPRLHRFNR
eukprot:CAMPEP_0197914436 /NCGR_PEP_ID=MMETSP1439-20131203/78495_1 /TAXON_ID=66791 /ORGANISM="Gonyaulax spinifera, Strain CCMP409" /LENGTH=39 /DNA_ID= /DNA_START= /DNA_END= /DNA_ORIENTATION=